MRIELEIGSNYGKWTVLKFDGVDIHRCRRYKCRCECGFEKLITAGALAAGRTKSCPRCKSDDLTGRQFGLWTVISRSDDKSIATNYHTLWLCKCTCERIHSVERCNLIRGNSKGCWICRRNVIECNKFPKVWYRKLLEQAKQRGHYFEISEDELWQVWELQKGICSLSGLKIEITNALKTTTASVDRIDNSLGYIIGNVWFIHKHLNMMKYRYDLNYFTEMCCRVADQVYKEKENGSIRR